MVLEKDSSVLGYPGETSKALDADHHGVCKYDSPKDPNYIVVRNVLKSLVSKILAKSGSGLKKPSISSPGNSRHLKSMLRITELPDTDYIFYRDQWTPSTSEWILKDKVFLQWRGMEAVTPNMLWLKGGPATGKSVLSSFIINDLAERGDCCQYFFIKFADRTKRSLTMLLRSIAYQIAQSIPEFSLAVYEVADEAMNIADADYKTLWERLFKALLFKMASCRPLYWVIDGIDEAEEPRAMLKLISDTSTSLTPIKVLLVSRDTSEIASALRKGPRSLQTSEISIEDQTEDLRLYILQELDMLGTTEFRNESVKRLLEGSQNNFLVSLLKPYAF